MYYGEEIAALKEKNICFECVGENYLSDEINASGKRRKCSYCLQQRRSYKVDDFADRVAQAFHSHYVRTADQPDSFQSMMMRDREIDYGWERDGEPVIQAIMDAAEISETVAEDVQSILEDANGYYDPSDIGEETEFSSESYYTPVDPGDGTWRHEWEEFERSLKSEARFFSRRAADHLASVFEGIDELRTRKGQPLLVEAGPEAALSSLFRARVFQSDDKLETALCRPDRDLGSPPSLFASAGRMNARGISVFYGASVAAAAIAEVRPPVGSQVAVARFDIVRKVKLLDLTALRRVDVQGSIFDPSLARKMERAAFLRSLSSRITRPVMPDDEPFEYLATQAIADFLATSTPISVDGIIYPSVQVADSALNVVLFHKAALVEPIDLPAGAVVRARTGQMGEDGWEDDYSVIEEVPPAPSSPPEPSGRDAIAWPTDLAELARTGILGFEATDVGYREPTLRVDARSIVVHQVRRIAFETDEFMVTRYRREKRKSPF